LTNNYESLNLEGMTLCWKVLHEGFEVERGSLTLPAIPSCQAAEVIVPYTTEIDNGEYLLNLSVCLAQATSWAEAGHAIASTQYTLNERNTLAAADATAGTPLKVTKSGTTYYIEGEDMSMKVNTTNGITYWNMGGLDVIATNSGGKTAPAYSNYRWIENDAPYGTDPYYSAENGITSRTFDVTESGDGATVTITEIASGNLCNYKFVYTVNRDGTVDLDAQYTPCSNSLRRIGMQMQLNPELIMTEYYARGPLDNTIDRKQGADLGIYSRSVKDYHVDYVRPQTSGDRQDVRWVTFYGANGDGIKVETEGQVNMTIDNYTDAYMHNYLHQWQMDASNDVFVNFDVAQLGVGNGSCGAGVLSKYVLPASGTYTYKLRFSYLEEATTGIEQLPSVPSNVENTDNRVFNIHGQVVNTNNALPKGIYITNGKKFIVK
jgi:beta-galactosidase